MNDLINGPSAPAPDHLQSFDTPPAVPPVSTEPAPAERVPAEPAAVAPVETPPADGTAPAATPPGIPEGVKVRKLDGKEVWAVDPAAGRATFDRAALVTEAEEIMGEPLSKEAVEFRQRTVEGLEGMRGDLLSDKPEDQLNVVNHLGDIIRQARDNGEIGHNAVESLVKVTIDSALSGQDAALTSAVLSHIGSSPLVRNGLIESIYQMALTEPDQQKAEDLWNSAQQIDNRLNNGQFRTNKEMEYLRASKATSLPQYQRAGQPPTTPAAAPAAAAPAAQGDNGFEAWSNETNSAVHNGALLTGIDEALNSAVDKGLRDKYPTDFQATRKQLISLVEEKLLGDQTLRNQTAVAVNRARLAVNPAVRNQIRDEIVRRHSAEAARILRDNKGPILQRFAEQMAGKSAAETQRAAAGQRVGRQAPSSGGPSAARVGTHAPTTGTFKNNVDFNKELNSVLS